MRLVSNLQEFDAVPLYLCKRHMGLICFVFSIGLTALSAASANATAIGPLDSPHIQGTGEMLEPTSNRPLTIGRPTADNSNEPAALQSVPEPSIEVYEGLDRNISESRTGDRDGTGSFFGVEKATELPFSLTALEWTQQMAEDGSWLENDQWADFRAIALASYLPEISFWLGRDRWAAFGALPIGDDFANDLSGTTVTPDGVPNLHYPTMSYNGGYNDLRRAGDGSGQKKPGPTNGSVYEWLLGMVKKTSRQPAFYLAILGGGAVLFFAIKRQSAIKTP